MRAQNGMRKIQSTGNVTRAVKKSRRVHDQNRESGGGPQQRDADVQDEVNERGKPKATRTKHLHRIPGFANGIGICAGLDFTTSGLRVPTLDNVNPYHYATNNAQPAGRSTTLC